MAGGVAQLVVRVVSDTNAATKGLDGVASKADRMKAGLGTAAKVSGAALLGLGAAAISAGNAAAEDAAQQAVLATALRKNAGANDEAIASTEDWIDATARATGVADDQLRPALATLVRATGDTAVAQGALTTAMDVSAATGKSVESVSAALAKGYAGNTSALGRLVPGLDEAAIKSGDMALVMDDLAAKTGGTAAAAADTAAGSMARMGVTMDETKETLGAALIPAMDKFAKITAKAAEFVEKHSGATQILIGIVAALAVGIIVVNAALKAYRAFVVVSTAVQWLWNAALAANPIGLIVLAILALAAALVIAWKKSETFREIVTKAWEAVKSAAKSVLDWLGQAWSDVWGTLKSVAEPVLDAVSGGFDNVMGVVQSVIDAVQDLIGWISKIKIPDIGGAIGGLIPGNPFSATAAPAGFAAPSGSSLAVPMVRAGGGGGVNITVNGAIDPEATARQIRRILDGHDRRMGLTP